MAFNGKFELNGILKGTIGSNSSLSGKLANEALRGYSAYELAVLNGFDGTEEEWLESLKSAVDLKPYSTTKENDEKYQPKGEYADKKHTHDEYLTEHQDLSGYVTKEELENIDIPTSWNDLKDKPFYEDEQGEVVPLDEKYIPTNIARKSDLDEISENSPLIDYTLTDNKQYINLWEFEKTGYYLITNNTSSDMVFIFAKTGTGKDSIATKILEMGMNIIKKGESVIAYAMHINSEYQLTFLKNAKSIKTYVNAYVPSTNTWESLVEKVITDSSFSSSHNGKFLSIANGVITPVEIPSDYVTEAELKEAIANAPTGVASWNDLKDKPFYEVESVQELYSDTLEFEFVEEVGLGACNSEIPYQVLRVDQKIKVAWNDVEYDLVLQNFEMQPGALIAGNCSLINAAMGGSYEDTGEPFLIACLPESASTLLNIFTNSTEKTHDISISSVSCTTFKLDKKYIPTHEHSWNDLEDKPFGEDELVQEMYGNTLFKSSAEDTFGLSSYTDLLYGLALEVDQKIKITWDDVEYDCLLQNFEMEPGVLIAGNGSLLNDATGFTYEDTGEPFIILCNPNIEDANTDLIILTNEKENNHNIFISLVTIQINGKHIPNGIFVVNITDNGDGTCSADKTGKEFMEAYNSNRTIVCKDEYSYYYFNHYGEAMDSRTWCFISIPGYRGGSSGNGNTYIIKELTFNNTFNSNEGDWYYREMELATKEALEHTHSWNDLTDKPFYEDVKTIIEEKEWVIPYSMNSGEYQGQFDADLGELPLNAGEKYIVAIDGVEYESMCLKDGDVFGFMVSHSGNMVTDIYDEDFICTIVYLPNSVQIMLGYHFALKYEQKDANVRIGVKQRVELKQLDEKFIPSTIARKSEIETAMNSALGDIESALDAILGV